MKTKKIKNVQNLSQITYDAQIFIVDDNQSGLIKVSDLLQHFKIGNIPYLQERGPIEIIGGSQYINLGSTIPSGTEVTVILDVDPVTVNVFMSRFYSGSQLHSAIYFETGANGRVYGSTVLTDNANRIYLYSQSSATGSGHKIFRNISIL